MPSEALGLLLRANLLIAAAVVFVLLVRPLCLRLAGPRVAYRLWILPLLAGGASLFPTVSLPTEARMVTALPAAAEAAGAWVARSADAATRAPDWLGPIWLAGAAACLALFVWRQVRFQRSLGVLSADLAFGRDCLRASSCDVGPAAVGLFPPRVVLPADFERRFDAGERTLVLAHERGHIAAGDTWAGALLAALQAINWFNPLVHLAAHYLRRDQEMACDAAVLARFPANRRCYAEAILKTQLAPIAAPFAYAWPTGGIGDLKERIAGLGRRPPSVYRRIAGFALVLAASVTSVCAARASQPFAAIWHAVAPGEALLFVEAGPGVAVEGAGHGFLCADRGHCVFTLPRGVPVRMRGSGREPAGLRWTGCDAQAAADRCTVTLDDEPVLVTLR